MNFKSKNKNKHATKMFGAQYHLYYFNANFANLG